MNQFFFLFNYLAYFANQQSGLQQKIFALQNISHLIKNLELNLTCERVKYFLLTNKDTLYFTINDSKCCNNRSRSVSEMNQQIHMKY